MFEGPALEGTTYQEAAKGSRPCHGGLAFHPEIKEATVGGGFKLELDFGQTSLEAGLEMGNSYCEAGPVRKLPWRPGRVRILCLETQELGPGTTSDHPLRNFDGSSSDGWGVNAPSATKTEMLLPQPPPPGQFA